jgi:hypothetical protein
MKERRKEGKKEGKAVRVFVLLLLLLFGDYHPHHHVKGGA